MLKKNEVDLTLRCEIKEKSAVEVGDSPNFVKRAIPDITQSWRSYQQQLVLEDLSKHVCQIAEMSEA